MLPRGEAFKLLEASDLQNPVGILQLSVEDPYPSVKVVLFLFKEEPPVEVREVGLISVGAMEVEA
jgi:hypothetical protein